MQDKLPPDVITNIVEILYYFAAGAIGWIAKLLTTKKRTDERPKR